jgi:D-sedoheptulose 7-phosphate isomerase
MTSVSSFEVNAFLDFVSAKWLSGAKFVICGNGGSALSALHIATDLSKGVRLKTGKTFRCQTLTDNVGILTAYANDDSYMNAFAEQVEGQLLPGDVLIAISVSGNSENVVRAVKKAREVGAATIGLCGFDGGKLLPLVDVSVLAPSRDMQLCEDIHMSLGHMLMQHLCNTQTE